MKFFQTAATALMLGIMGVSASMPTYAQAAEVTEINAAQTKSGVFVKKSKKLKGTWEIVQRGDQTFIVFGDDFRAARGPDLKIFLSPMTLADVTGETAIDGALKLGELKKTKGAQEYEIPVGVNLADYSSVLVHCEAYVILWGGGDL